METRIEEYATGELAALAGVSVRTLHHYDRIGLLSPAHVGPNGYRIYRRPEAERLQEILFYRATGMTLADIAALLDGGAGRLERLERHRARLAQNLSDIAVSLDTLDRTIADIKGGDPMPTDRLYAPFSAEKQADYERWLIDTYGPSMAKDIARSKAHLAKAPDGMEARMAALKPIEAALVAAFEAGRAEVDAEIAAHRDWVASMWGKACPPAAYAGLADMYLSHPDFVARYEALAPRFSQWLPERMKDWAARQGA